MSANNSQIGNTPLELLFGNNENKSNLDQLLSVEIVTTSPPSIQFTTTNMIPSQIIPLIRHVSEHANLSRRQIGRRRRRQRLRQRRQQQRQQRPNELQPQYQHQLRRQRSRMWFEDEWDHDNWGHLGYPEYMEENTTQLLEVYDWEKTDPMIRWEQEQLNELEGFVVLEQLALIQDEIEQLYQIELVEKSQEEEKQQRNSDELVQIQEWEHIAFLVQQLNQN